MKVTYDIYRRYAERDRATAGVALNRDISEDIYYGKRYELIQDYNSISMTLNFKKRSKFTIKGKSIGQSPLEIGDSIIVYRNAELFFTGIVDTVEIKCKDISTNSLEWEASGEDESTVYNDRIIMTYTSDIDTVVDPEVSRFRTKGVTFEDDVYDKCKGYARDRMIHYIRNCFDPEWMGKREDSSRVDNKKRQLKGTVVFPESSEDMKIPVADRGKDEESSYRLKKLSTVLEEIGKDDNLFARFQWNPITGVKEFSVPVQNDVSGMDKDKTYDPNEIVVVSPNFGNVAKWSVIHKAPKYNAVWICSGENETYAENQPEFKCEYLYDETTGLRNGVRLGFFKVMVDPYSAVDDNGWQTITEIGYDNEYMESYQAEMEAWEEKKKYYDDMNKARKRRLIGQFFNAHGITNLDLDKFNDNDITQLGWFDWFDDIAFDAFVNRIWVYAEDADSIAKYGLKEEVIIKNDIKVTDMDKRHDSDTTRIVDGKDGKKYVVEIDKNGNEVSRDPILNDDDVIKLLKEEAEKALKENAAQDKYTITLAQTDEFVFMENWRCGDKVKVVIDGKEFASTIETVSVSYNNNSETVTPTVGATEEGVFGEVFAMINGMEKRLKAEEES